MKPFLALAILLLAPSLFAAPEESEPCFPSPVAYVGAAKTIRAGDSVRLGGMPIFDQTYRWSPADTLDDPNISSPLATPTQDTVYTLKVSTVCGWTQKTVVVRVIPFMP